MGNEYRMVFTTIWADPDFKALSESAQRLYMLMLTHPSLSACGVLDWREPKLAAFAADSDVRKLRAAAYELGRGAFIAIDPDTEEALVRSFVRHDGKLKSPNPTRAVVKAYGSIGSRKLMQIVSVEVRRACEEHPEWKGIPFAEEIIKQFPEADSYPSQMVPKWFAEPFEMSSDSVRNEFEISSNFDTPKNAEPFEMSSHNRITDKPTNREVINTSILAASEKTQVAPAQPRRKPKTPIKDTWQPNTKHAQQAHALGLNLTGEASKFRRDALAHDRRYARWDQAFANWLTRSAEYAPPRNNPISQAPAPANYERLTPPEELQGDPYKEKEWLERMSQMLKTGIDQPTATRLALQEITRTSRKENHK